jgi:hypothetical protein
MNSVKNQPCKKQSSVRLVMLICGGVALAVSLSLLTVSHALEVSLLRSATWNRVATAAGLTEEALLADLSLESMVQKLPAQVLQLTGDPIRFFSEQDRRQFNDTMRQTTGNTLESTLAQIPVHLQHPEIPIRVVVELSAARNLLTDRILDRLPPLVAVMARSPLKEGAQALIPDAVELVPQAHAIMLALKPVGQLQRFVRLLKRGALVGIVLGLLLMGIARCTLRSSLIVSGGSLVSAGGLITLLPSSFYRALISLGHAATATGVSLALTADIATDIRMPGLVLLVSGIALLVIAGISRSLER